jgi:outer membrane protein assembly factor BamB
VTGATADSVYFLIGVHLYSMNAGTGALQWGLLITDARSALSWEGEDPEKRQRQRQRPAPQPGGQPAALRAWPPVMSHHDVLLGLAVQNGRVFVTSRSFAFALDADSGGLLWEHYTGLNHDSPVVAGDTVYVPSGIIHALSTRRGSKRWSYITTGYSETTRPVIDKDTLYIGSFDNVLYALDCVSGQARWIYHTGGRVYVAPMVDQGVVYAGSMEAHGDDWPRIFALDATSGHLLWKSSRISDATVRLAVAAGVLYTSDWRTGLFGLDCRTGAVIWEYSGLDVVSLLVQGQVLYAASASGKLHAFDTQTHQLLWQQTVRPRAGAVSRLKLLGDELYVGFNGLGEYADQFVSIHAINALTGGEDWSATVRWNASTLDLA